MNTTQSFNIRSAQGLYSVDFDATIFELVANLSLAPHAVVIVDRKVANHYRATLEPLFQGRPVYEIDATEDEKTLEGCARALSFLQSNRASRQTHVIALGGGIVQDIVTFCTHVYFRGLKWTYIPTTLLGMADSCIGAKASINFQGFKNQLGVFHSPTAVRICLDFLTTLPEVEIISGYGEIVKLHLVGSRVQFDDLVEVLNKEGWRNSRLAQFVRASLLIKKAIIEVDEFDDGIRRTLNYGHTFGHALEAITHHGIPHGLAVAWGIDLVNYIAVQRKLLAQGDFDQIHTFLAAKFHWKLNMNVSCEELLEATKRDKKSKGGKLNLVLPNGVGQLELYEHDYDQQLDTWVTTYLKEFNIVICPAA